MGKTTFIVTFGQKWRLERHPHAINGVYPHPDGWFEITAPTYAAAMQLAQQAFGGEFANLLTRGEHNPTYYPLGRMGQIPALAGDQFRSAP